METLWPFSVVLPIMSSNVRREDGGRGGWNLDWYGSGHLQLQDRCILYRSFFILQELKAIYPLNGMIDESLLQCVCANCYHLSYLMTDSHYQFGKAAHPNQIYPTFQQNNFIHPVTKLKYHFRTFHSSCTPASDFTRLVLHGRLSD